MTDYRDVLTHKVSGTLVTISTVSLLGDWIGFGALLILAFERSSGTVIGPAALFTVQGLAAALSSTLVGPYLDRTDRRLGMVAGYVGGGAAILLPLAFDGLWPLYVATALIGALRPLTAALRHATAGIDLPPRLLGPTIALEGSIGQTLVGLGLAVGGAVAVGEGATVALVLDAITFGVAGLLALRLPSGRGTNKPASSRLIGFRAVFADPATARLALIVVGASTVGALPETLAPLASHAGNEAWLPFVLGAQAAGTGLGSFLVGTGRRFEQPSGLLALMAGAGAALIIGGMAFDHHPAALGTANLLFGLAFTFTVTGRTAFTRTLDNQRLGAAIATAITLVMFAEAIGSIALAAVAEAVSPLAAYAVAGVIVLGLAVTAAGLPWRRGPDATGDHPVTAGARLAEPRVLVP